MFDMIKPQLVALLSGAVLTMEKKSAELTARANTMKSTEPAAVVLHTRAGIWADAAAMIRESLAP